MTVTTPRSNCSNREIQLPIPSHNPRFLCKDNIPYALWFWPRGTWQIVLGVPNIWQKSDQMAQNLQINMKHLNPCATHFSVLFSVFCLPVLLDGLLWTPKVVSASLDLWCSWQPDSKNITHMLGFNVSSSTPPLGLWQCSNSSRRRVIMSHIYRNVNIQYPPNVTLGFLQWLLHFINTIPI